MSGPLRAKKAIHGRPGAQELDFQSLFRDSFNEIKSQIGLGVRAAPLENIQSESETAS